MSKAIVRSLSFLLVLFSSLTFIWAQEPESKQNQPASDNTKINQRDRSKSEPTADQQKENRSDRELARQIRRAIVKDKSLSTYAKNIKIITQNGNVTLRGPVRSEQDKQAIESKANEVAGPGHVKSEIQIAAKANGKKTGKRTTN